MSRDRADWDRGDSTRETTGDPAGDDVRGAGGAEGADSGSGAFLSRRRVLGGLGGLAATGSTVGSASAGFFGGGDSDTGTDVPSPTVEGPIEGGSTTGGPQTAAPIDVGEYGYVEAEYFVAGDARHDEYFFGGENEDETAEYRTRVLVYRPESRLGFNGSVLVEWFNVSTQMDMAVAWPAAYDSMMRNGTAVALVSAQKVGVDDSTEDADLVTWDPERYGDLHHPGDRYALDIFAQVNKTLVEDNDGRGGVFGRRLGGGLGSGRGFGDGSSPGGDWWSGSDEDGDDGDGPHPLGDMSADALMATGHSQSAFYLLRYINLVAPEYGLIDGFMPAGNTLTTARADVAPVLWVNSEDEADTLAALADDEEGDTPEFDYPPDGLRLETETQEPREDEGLFKLWEVAGASHVNYWLSAWSEAKRARDFQDGEADFDPQSAGQYGELSDGTYGECGFNYFPERYAWRAAIEHLREWITRGDEPPRADRIERTVHEDGTVDIHRDEDGNARGGLRLPPIDVPVATYDARTCDLVGRTARFDEETLDERYPSNEAYVDELRSAAVRAVARGHMRRRDARYLLERARESPIGE